MTNTSMKIHSGVLNVYTPRDYPKDTPAEAAVRMAGFEAGRQYEASLRDGDPAVLIPASEFAALNPYDGAPDYCIFCGEADNEPHATTCLWIRCGGKP